MNFYACIIGTELLNGRRNDAHFPFLNAELLKRGWEQAATFIIADKPPLIRKVFELVKADPQSVMFCFGGIGATPDDYTRKAAADVFTDGAMSEHSEALRRIVERFGDDARPYRIHMAMLPQGADLLDNPVNNVPGFSLSDRFFFVPGFPQMAHPMIAATLERLYPRAAARTRLTLSARCSENSLIDLMEALPPHIELSSLPIIAGDARTTVISLAGDDPDETRAWFGFFRRGIEDKKIAYVLGDERTINL